MEELIASGKPTHALQAHISVVVPVYNNATTIRELAERTVAVFGDCCTRRHELCLVDDGSSDDSWAVITNLSNRFSEVSGLRLSRNFGQHAAISAGIAQVTGETTCLMDADLEHRPEDLPKLVAGIEAGADLVIAIDEGVVRRKSSDLFQRVFGRLSKTVTHPKALTFRVMNESFKQALEEYQEVDVVLGPLMSSMGYSQQYIPVRRTHPHGRETRYSATKRLGLAMKALLIHATFIPALLGWFAFFVALGFLSYAIIVVVQAVLFGSQLPSGITLLLLVILASSSAILGALGFISYIGIGILREVKQRPRFHVAQVVDSTSDD